MFLDSAQVRNNVVSRAKMLGYTPRSSQGSTATIKLTVTPDDAPNHITIPALTQFVSTIDGIQYVYVNPEARVINANSSCNHLLLFTICLDDMLTQTHCSTAGGFGRSAASGPVGVSERRDLGWHRLVLEL